MVGAERTAGRVRWAVLLLVAVSACGGGGESGLGAADPDQLARLSACMPQCLARAFAQVGCTPVGECRTGGGKICYANGVSIGSVLDMSSAMTVTTVRRQDATICYSLSVGTTADKATTVVRSPNGAQIASIVLDPSNVDVWHVSCEGQTTRVDTAVSPCKEALKIQGAGSCSAGTCP